MKHRGPGPKDKELFKAENLPLLRKGVADLSWLLSRGYPMDASLALVGNRYDLVQRQRVAVRRCACSDQQLASRRKRRRTPSQARGRPLWIDGFNLLITLETALGGGVLLRGRDGCLRDLAELRGSYRQVVETVPAIGLLLGALRDTHPSEVRVLLDRPVSNSGRIKALLLEAAEGLGIPFGVELVPDPDPLLIRGVGNGAGEKEDGSPLIASADSAILDGCGAWVDLLGDMDFSAAWIMDLVSGIRGRAGGERGGPSGGR